jgi:pimeloyl-ACP methyl ester carboxylesterase
MADALFLCGYSNVNMKDMQIWQCSKIDGGDAMLEACFNAVGRKDNEYLMNHMGVTAEWLSAHYKLTSNQDVLPKLNLPIYIFHGTADGYCDIRGVYEINNTFNRLDKTNLTVHVFDNHGHGLEVIGASDDSISDGIETFLNVVYNY